MNRTEYEQFLHRYSSDPHLPTLLKDIFNSAKRYWEVRDIHESLVAKKPSEMDDNEYRQTVQDKDLSRRLAHNSLISSLNIANRRLRSIGEPPIIEPEVLDEKDPHLRTIVAEWAKNIL